MGLNIYPHGCSRADIDALDERSPFCPVCGEPLYDAVNDTGIPYPVFPEDPEFCSEACRDKSEIKA